MAVRRSDLFETSLTAARPYLEYDNSPFYSFRMSRPLRIQYPGALYHVTARGNERKPIVRDDKDRWLFIRVLEDMVESHDVIIYAWVLMDNHFHLLIETPQANLSASIRHLNGVFTQRFNRRHERSGHLFQGRYKSILVDKESYLKELCRYVVLNPFRAGMVKHPRDWKWSSYRATAGYAEGPSWLNTSWLLSLFHKKTKMAQGKYRQFVMEGANIKESPWEKVSSQVLLGRSEFESFIREKACLHPHKEASLEQQSLALPKPEEVLFKISGLFEVSAENILSSTKQTNEGREAAMWALQSACRLRLREIAAEMGVGYSAVSHAVSKVRKRMREDAEYGRKIRTAIFKT